MKLLSVRVSCPDGFGELELGLADEAEGALGAAVVFGGPGSGKTALLSAVLNTRPGNTVAWSLRPADLPCFAECRWLLGLDEPDRRRPLHLSSPNAPPEFAAQDLEQRREAAFFDKLAREGGFVCLCFSALRWFSKSPLALSAPERTVRRYDVRGHEPLDDATRNDLTRDVKQALAYAAIVRALPELDHGRHRTLGDDMANVVGRLVNVYGFEYLGLDPASLEPQFKSQQGRQLSFDRLPTAVKHAVAFGALSVRALWAAYPGLSPLLAQGVIAVDQLELNQDAVTAVAILDVLSSTLPNVQWLVTTRMPELLSARASEERFVLRKSDADDRVRVHTGDDARLH